MASSEIAHTPVALVYQSAALHAHLRQALGDAGASVVYESATASFDNDELSRSGASVVVVNLDPDSDEDLDAIDGLLVDDTRKIIINDGELTSKLSGWDQARWARHLVAKIFGGNELLPQRPPGAVEVPVRGMPQHGLDNSNKPGSMSAPVVSHAAEESASRELAEAFSSFSVPGAVADAELTARDELEAALRDFGFVSDDPPLVVAASALRETLGESPTTADATASDNPFGALDFDLATDNGETSASTPDVGGMDDVQAPAAGTPEPADEFDAVAVTTAKSVDEFDALFSFDPTPAASVPGDAALPSSAPTTLESLDFDLDFPDSFSEPNDAAADLGAPVAAEADPESSLFAFDFELDTPIEDGAAESRPAATQDADALIDFDQAFGLEQSPEHAVASDLSADDTAPDLASSAQPDPTGGRSVEQLLAGLDLQLTDFEPAEVARGEDRSAIDTATESVAASAPEAPTEDRFASFSFELEAIEEAPRADPERAVVEQFLLDPQSGKSRVAAAVAAAAAAVKPAAESVASTLAPFDHLFDEQATSVAGPQAAAGGLRRVWVLGASIGGPDAVREFLSGIPANSANLFLLAQHMGADFVDLMIGQLARASALPVSLAAQGEIAAHGQVLVVPLAERLLLDRDGQVSIEALPAPSAYCPSIDQVLKDVADRFGADAGAIIFSGMAHDAIDGAKYLASKGGVVWAQDPATCVVSSMIDGAIEAGVVKFVASPAELASRFVAEFP